MRKGQSVGEVLGQTSQRLEPELAVVLSLPDAVSHVQLTNVVCLIVPVRCYIE